MTIGELNANTDCGAKALLEPYIATVLKKIHVEIDWKSFKMKIIRICHILLIILKTTGDRLVTQKIK